jgi:hypothetical protein
MHSPLAYLSASRRRSLLAAIFTVIVFTPLSATLLAPSAGAHPGEGFDVTFSDGVTCNLDAAWPHYSRDHGDVSAAATVTCRGGSVNADLQTVIQGPSRNDHAPIVANCVETRYTGHIGSDVYFVNHPCHAGSYPGDGVYYSYVSADLTRNGETKDAFDSEAASVQRS